MRVFLFLLAEWEADSSRVLRDTEVPWPGRQEMAVVLLTAARRLQRVPGTHRKPTPGLSSVRVPVPARHALSSHLRPPPPPRTPLPGAASGSQPTSGGTCAQALLRNLHRLLAPETQFLLLG